VIELLQRISANNYTVVYLTARSMANDIDTRRYLFQVELTGLVM
jgi:phosphatidate phosphatase PAH1